MAVHAVQAVLNEDERRVRATVEMRKAVIKSGDSERSLARVQRESVLVTATQRRRAE